MRIKEKSFLAKRHLDYVNRNSKGKELEDREERKRMIVLWKEEKIAK